MVDPFSLVDQLSPAIIESLLNQKQKIDQENAEILERMRNEAFGSIPGKNSGGLSQRDLEQYQNNLDNLLSNILKQALEKKVMNQGELQSLIDQVNKHSDTKIDLNNVLPLQLTDEQKQLQEKQKQLEEEQKRLLEEQNKLRELAAAKNQSLLDRIKAEQERIEQENKNKLEEARKQAEEKLKQQLSDAAKQKFEEQKKPWSSKDSSRNRHSSRRC